MTLNNKYNFVPLDKPVLITKQKWNLDKDSLVYIQVLTYNHEPYIRDCIDGILLQKTTFPVHIVVFEDCSTDRTANILKEYQLKYPHLFTMYLQPVNTYGKDIRKEALKPWYETAKKGKYIAKCEGDDYWTDPMKLQKQVDFLEKNEEYGLVHSECNFLYSDGSVELRKNESLGLSYHYDNNKEFLFDKLISGEYKIRTATVLFRKELLEETAEVQLKYQGLFKMGDTPMWLIFSKLKHFHYIDEVFAVYRISPNSASRPNSLKMRYRFVLSMFEMRIWFLEYYKRKIPENISFKYNQALCRYKMFDYKYNNMYQLLQPTKKQRILYDLNKIKIFRVIGINYLVLRIKLSKIKNKIIN